MSGPVAPGRPTTPAGRNSPFPAAWEVESLLLRRSTVVRIATPLLVLLMPLGSAGLVALARSPRLAGAAAPKLALYADGDLAATMLTACGQVLAVAVLGAGGFVLAWAFGRELADGTAGGLFGLAVSRRMLALARCLVVLLWSVACVVAAVAVAVVVALAASRGGPADGGRLAAEAARALIAGVLAAGLAFPFAWVATATRSPLGTVGVLVGVVALTQVVVLLGGGTWFPYAVPSLWTGTGGGGAAAAVGPPQLALTAAVAPAAIIAVVRAWHRLTDV